MSQNLSNSKWRVARKDHRCAACRRKIPKGELHYHFWGRWEGEWQDWRTHAECHEARDKSGEEEVCREIS